MPDRDEVVQAKRKAFLKAMAESGNITVSARVAKIPRQSHYDWLANDADGTYAAAFAAAEHEAADLLEKAAKMRAVEGVLEPVWYMGEEVGQVRKYSDTLLIFMLKGAKPDKYRERWQGQITGANDGPVQHEHRIDLTQLSDEELEIYARIVAKASNGGKQLSPGD